MASAGRWLLRFSEDIVARALARFIDTPVFLEVIGDETKLECG